MKKNHPYADIFPMMESDDFKNLVDDIRENGLKHKIVIHDGMILDGRNRYKACIEAGIEPQTELFTGNDPLQFVISENLHRRHLTASQKAAVAIEMDIVRERLEAEAKEKQKKGGEETHGHRHQDNLQVPEKIPEPVKSREQRETRTKIAKITGVNNRYIQDAKKIQSQAPDLHEAVKRGEIKIPDAKSLMNTKVSDREKVLDLVKSGAVKNVKKGIKSVNDEKKQKAVEKIEMKAAAKTEKKIYENQIAIMGDHILFCGDSASEKFRSLIEGKHFSFCFADPPYNAGVDDWDVIFQWNHDFLIDTSEIVCVTPGISSIHDFLSKTKMRYRWSIACWIKNGMTRGALGFGNWIYGAIFSKKESIHKNAQDFFQCTISGEYRNHRGQKPAGFIVDLVNLFSSEGDMVLDPFLGSGTTLFVCEETGRKCVGAEINNEYCSKIINLWEMKTGKEAKIDAI